VWYGFGFVKELLDLPLTLLNRYIVMMEDEKMKEQFQSMRSINFRGRG